MSQPKKEVKRRNGFYPYKGFQLPSVSIILKSAGSSEGLIYWGCKQGGLGVIWGLSKLKDLDSLKEKLGSPACIEWAVEQAKQGLAAEGNRVKDFGSRVHSGIEARLKIQELDQSEWTEEEKTALKTFENFYQEVGFDPFSVETAIYSVEHRYAGTLDLVASFSPSQADLVRPYLTRSSSDIEEGLLICDFKTGAMYPKSQSVQLAAYARAYLETYGRKCTGGLIINIHREEPEKIKCHYFSKEELDEAFNEGFLSGLQVWKFFDAPKWFHNQFKIQVVQEQERSIA